MKENKDFNEIEIEQIDLDVDQNYDVSLDISSIDDLGSMPKSSDTSLDEIEVIEDVSEKQKVSINKDIQQPPDLDEDKSVSISNDELENILSDVTLEEEEGVTVDLSNITELESITTKMDEDIFSKAESLDETSRTTIEEEPETISIESLETLEETPIQKQEPSLDESIFTKASEAIAMEKEISSEQQVIEASEETLELTTQSDVISISTEDYNKLVEESQGIPLVDRPEEILEITDEETIPLGEPISPEEIGVSLSEKPEELELEFETEKTLGISEETIISDKIIGEDIGVEEQFQSTSFEEEIILESPTEVSYVGEGSVLEEIEKTSEEHEPVASLDEEIDIKTEVLMDTKEKQKEFSVMPDEVGVEEIIIEQPKQTEQILGIGFEDESSKEEEISISEETYSEEVISGIGVVEIPTQPAITTEEFATPEERLESVEEAIDTLPEQDKEDIKKILTYLDRLLESLPEDKIKEFASSEYYDLYIRIFDKLKIR